MIKVRTDIIPASDGIDLDTEVIVTVPKGLPKEISDQLARHEITALLKKMYEQHPDIIVDAIQVFISDVEEET